MWSRNYVNSTSRRKSFDRYSPKPGVINFDIVQPRADSIRCTQNKTSTPIIDLYQTHNVKGVDDKISHPKTSDFYNVPSIEPMVSAKTTSAPNGIIASSQKSAFVAKDNRTKKTKLHLKIANISSKVNKKPTNKIAKLGKSQKLFYAVGMTVFVLAGLASIQGFAYNRSTKQKLTEVLGSSTSSSESSGSIEQLSEQKPSNQALSSYSVSDPTFPRYISIPELNVFSRVKSLGLDKQKAVDVPNNIYDVGWYNLSAKPGSSSGASLLVGHVSGWTADGVFKHLDKLKAGSKIVIETGNGKKLSYQVTSISHYKADSVPMDSILAEDVKGTPDIKLITCAGKYNSNTKDFSERVVVYAQVVGSM